MSIETSVEEDKTVIEISGDLTVGYVIELHSVLREALQSSDSVEIKVGDVERADLTLLQLFCSAHRAALSKDKRFDVTGKKNELLCMDCFTGFTRVKGCVIDRYNNCALVKERSDV
ncbi:lipid asymmetry maintenance protein MlaB [Seleniivibrio woodruffii]|uniref:STAS domain-containing protein n=1 Tax=Seleniivibrio woodruffii TaxID=1078050 RepID=UPI0026EBB290|nr:STAS domain-containing protein [Seleniivibrio woodruffii]